MAVEGGGGFCPSGRLLSWIGLTILFIMCQQRHNSVGCVLKRLPQKSNNYVLAKMGSGLGGGGGMGNSIKEENTQYCSNNFNYYQGFVKFEHLYNFLSILHLLIEYFCLGIIQNMYKIWASDFFLLLFLRLSLYMCVLCCCSSKLTLNNDKTLQFRIYVYTILSTYGYVQYVSDQNGYHTHKRTNCNIMYQHSDVTRLRCTLFNKKTYFGNN